MTKYISTTETAKIIRNELADAFPGIKFSVRSKKYAGGASINVDWTDGPITGQVDEIIQQYRGADFDSMTDMKVLRSDAEHDGERVHWGADYIFAHRNFSPAVIERFTLHVAEFWGIEDDNLTEQHGDRIMPRRIHSPNFAPGYDLLDMTYQEMRKWDAADGLPRYTSDLPTAKEARANREAFEREMAARAASVVAVKPTAPAPEIVPAAKRNDWRVW